jgi:hypothetical protein
MLTVNVNSQQLWAAWAVYLQPKRLVMSAEMVNVLFRANSRRI